VRTDDITIICLYLEGINDGDLSGSFNGSINGHALDLTSIAVEVSTAKSKYTHYSILLWSVTHSKCNSRSEAVICPAAVMKLDL
jgi:hypothetical protein